MAFVILTVMSSEVPESVEHAPRRGRFGRIGCIVALIALIGLGYWLGPVAKAAIKLGFFEKVEKRSYAGTSIDNLRAMHMAMMTYHESEEAFPDSTGWMDAIEGRLQAFDMSKSESAKKMIHPEYIGQKDKFGYAMNDAASRMYKDDILEPDSTPLLFDSSDASRNAHGDPKKLSPNPPHAGGNQGISVNGQLLKMP